MKLLAEGNRERWLAARRLGIGSSDAPVLVGAGRKSLLELWSEKSGLTEDAKATELMEDGLELQGGIGRIFARRTKRTLIELPPWSVYQAADEPWMLASPDFFCNAIEGHTGPGGAEVKYVEWVRGDDWEEEPPLAAQVQVQHQMYVFKRGWWTVAGLVRGKLKYADVERDERFLKVLLELARDLWRRVELQDAPAPDASESARRTLAELFPREAPGKVIPLPPDAAIWDEQYVQACAEETLATARKKEAQNQLRALLGDAERGVLPNGLAWTLKTVSRKGYEVQPTSYRDLKRQKEKNHG